MIMGVFVFLGAAYLMVTGEYASLELRQQTESILGAFSIGGLVYSVAVWYLDLYFNPQFPLSES